MNVAKIIGYNVRRLRLAMGISQEQLSFRIEVINQAYVSELERGKRNPTAVLIAIIATALNVSPGDLFDVSGINEEWAHGPVEIRSKRTGRKSVGS
ncbi:helix-turn-helix transcriptional regulator [Asticcacaulis sp. BYS171W]|uniref:Helix-turn-helix transcriptional regulator n=1 Tax=Asticcacaulis aquaticus TaxID=2984212 RepID=A0ABT5HXC6_9CAUL|nr:helix-turn-helix transcriptional regulator [Asticcacaulis aquaticus]MDC7684718.1 helix-turn-helix transcriptional regulator [Asticcacaulis aquaticus]